jgi:hypothetical protein
MPNRKPRTISDPTYVSSGRGVIRFNHAYRSSRQALLKIDTGMVDKGGFTG